MDKSRHGVEVDIDGVPSMGCMTGGTETEPVQVNLVVDGYAMVGVEVQVDGSYHFGYFPPDDPNSWVVLHVLIPPK